MGVKTVTVIALSLVLLLIVEKILCFFVLFAPNKDEYFTKKGGIFVIVIESISVLPNHI